MWYGGASGCPMLRYALRISGASNWSKIMKSVHEDAAAVVPLDNQLPAELLDLAAQHAGEGVSNRAEDNLLPLIYIEQTGSPHVDKRSPDYIDGDEPGHFRLSNALDPIRNGVEGIEVIPCAMKRVWIEWLPNRQGFVAEHAEMPADAVTKIIDGDGGPRETPVRANGNVLQDTRQFYVLVDGAPYVLPCKGTGHTFARRWNSHFLQLRHPKTGDVLPSYIHKYKLTSVPERNAKGSWFGLKFTDLGPVTLAEFMAGKQLHQAVKHRTARAAAPITE
jgi:hypothetical protein